MEGIDLLRDNLLQGNWMVKVDLKRIPDCSGNGTFTGPPAVQVEQQALALHLPVLWTVIGALVFQQDAPLLISETAGFL